VERELHVESSMTEHPSTWDEVRRLADELELKIHLAGMNARDRWRDLQPRIEEIEKSVASAGHRAGVAIERELESIGVALRRLRDDIVKH
jgi:hypothetical protein